MSLKWSRWTKQGMSFVRISSGHLKRVAINRCCETKRETKVIYTLNTFNYLFICDPQS